MMGERDLARTRRRASSDQGGCRCAVMGRSVRPLRPVLRPELPVDAEDGRRLQGFGFFHRRQQAGKALGQHGLAGAGRADKQQAESASGCHFKRALRAGLTFDVAEIARFHRRQGGRDEYPGEGRVAVGLQGLDDFQQMHRFADDEALHQRGLGGAAAREQQLSRQSAGAQGQRHGERAAHRAQFTGKGEFTGAFHAGQTLGIDLAAGGEQTQRNRKIEAGAFLREVRGREVDRDALVGRELETAAVKRGADTFAGFLHLGVGESDEGEAGQAIGQVDFDVHGCGGQAGEGATMGDGEGHGEHRCAGGAGCSVCELGRVRAIPMRDALERGDPAWIGHPDHW